MSIIHDALKKVQQGLNPKNDEIEVLPPASGPKASAYIYDTPPQIEALPTMSKEAADAKPPIKNRIKSLMALTCALTITVGSGFYFYHQYQNYIPRAERYIKKYFYQLIHKPVIPDFKTKIPDELKPLLSITINPSTKNTAIANTPVASPMAIPETSPATSLATIPVTAGVAQAPVPITLNVHGIMANTSGGNLALINDQVYQEGDEVDGAKIIKINLNSITVDIGGREQTIRVKN